MESVLLVLFPLTFEQGQKEEVEKKKRNYFIVVQFSSILL